MHITGCHLGIAGVNWTIEVTLLVDSKLLSSYLMHTCVSKNLYSRTNTKTSNLLNDIQCIQHINGPTCRSNKALQRKGHSRVIMLIQQMWVRQMWVRLAACKLHEMCKCVRASAWHQTVSRRRRRLRTRPASRPLTVLIHDETLKN